MEIRMGCGDLSDNTLVELLESCNLRNDLFHHADHVRFAWICVRQFGEQVAAERVLGGIRQFAIHNGSPQKFHYTRTRAWVRLIAVEQQKSPDSTLFAEFVAAHPELLDANALAPYYSKSVLESPAALIGWVEPDISPLPSLSK